MSQRGLGKWASVSPPPPRRAIFFPPSGAGHGTNGAELFSHEGGTMPLVLFLPPLYSPVTHHGNDPPGRTADTPPPPPGDTPTPPPPPTKCQVLTDSGWVGRIRFESPPSPLWQECCCPSQMTAPGRRAVVAAEPAAALVADPWTRVWGLQIIQGALQGRFAV